MNRAPVQLIKRKKIGNNVTGLDSLARTARDHTAKEKGSRAGGARSGEEKRGSLYNGQDHRPHGT